ncbi:MAG: AbrB/MazE/SpoVT family DNA-binding domain-containing protein [Desulfobacteraceae bacterium]|nr:AbrB/MazE/SpoVT family DNA-binding domain-containing protein [Desulfobacteraceae bacterium]
MQVSKWGNSLAIRLPAALVEALELKEGDDIEITLAGVREMRVEKKPSREELMQRLRKVKWKLPSGFKFDRNEIYDERL